MGESVHEDLFVVYVRDLSAAHAGPENAEVELVSCSSYEDASWIRQEFSSRYRKCIIRHRGPTGGGD